jgi:hypothetical protein
MGNELPKLASRVTASKLDVSGDAPSSREAAAAVALSDTELLMFGGGGVSGCARARAAAARASLRQAERMCFRLARRQTCAAPTAALRWLRSSLGRAAVTHALHTYASRALQRGGCPVR